MCNCFTKLALPKQKIANNSHREAFNILLADQPLCDFCSALCGQEHCGCRLVHSVPNSRGLRHGLARLMNVTVYIEGTGVISDEKTVALVNEHFDVRPKGIIQMLDLLHPIFSKTAAYDHFGTDEPNFTWERVNLVVTLSAAVGLK